MKNLFLLILAAIDYLLISLTPAFFDNGLMFNIGEWPILLCLLFAITVFIQAFFVAATVRGE